MRTTAVVTAVAEPKKQQVKRCVHNVLSIRLLYTRNAVVLLIVLIADAHNEVPGINTVGIIRTVIYEYIYIYKKSMFCRTCFASHNTWLTGPAVGQWVSNVVHVQILA